MSDVPEHATEHASGPAPQSAKPARRLDARSLRGLAHPLRMNIFELLSLDGPATATQSETVPALRHVSSQSSPT
ncbi:MULTISPECIES: hypothetical protein [unclassified Streptomyces]|uniref:hypothetical protein n=1 Tax=unclassified Streptomyces TaxID=2593676 RepID=UPI001EF01B6E|nr:MULTISPECIES: hypothetical protein [unclassified Streptomyces]